MNIFISKSEILEWLLKVHRMLSNELWLIKTRGQINMWGYVLDSKISEFPQLRRIVKLFTKYFVIKIFQNIIFSF